MQWFIDNRPDLREPLQKFHYFLRDSFMGDVAAEISRRLSRLFLRDADGRRPVFGGAAMFQTDPHWRDLLLFYEYFHGDNGVGVGASHQTGWTGLVAKLSPAERRITMLPGREAYASRDNLSRNGRAGT